MNNIIGNTPYRNIQNKQYIDSSAEYISKLAERLQNENIPFSGRISEYKSTITVSGEDNLKKARKILNDIISENPRRYIGNTQYKYIRDKHIIPVEADIIDKIADRLNAEHIMYSGIVEGDKGRLTVSGAEIEALVKGYIEQEKSSTAAVTYEISLTSDAFEDIYYICDENGNAYYDKDGAIPTFNHVDEAEKYSKANNIPLTNDEELLNHWREIEHIDKIRHDNSKLVSMFKANGENYPDHFTYNASGNSFEWLYYNPDGNFGEGEFIRKTIYEQDIVAAYNARISAADENSGRNEFIYSLFSSCEEIVISSDTEEFTTVANEYINKSETTLELYGIAENSSNIAAVDRLISALEEKCPAVRSAEESRNNAVINEQSDNIDIDGHIGTWYVIDSAVIDGKSLYLLESEIYGDEAACIIVDESKNIIMSDVWNGFDDYQAYLSDHQARISNKNSPAEINSPVGNDAPEKELSLSEQLLKIAKKELEEYENSLDTAEKAKAAAYELTVKRDILSYIEYDLSNDIADLDVQAAVENLIKSGAPLSVYYDEWLKNEYDSRMEAVRMTAADVHKIEIQHNSEIERDSEKYEVVSEPFEEYTAPKNQLPDGMAVIDDIDNAILMWERGVEVYHNNEPIPAHKADDKVYEIFAEQDGIYTASKSDVEMFSDANAIASAIWDMNEIFNSVPNEQGQPYYLSLSNSYDEWTDYETGLNEYENTLNALYGGNYSSVITYIENVRDSDEVSKELQEQADSLLDEVKNFKKLFGIPEKDIKEKNIEAVQNIKVGDEITFNEKTYVITSITDDFMMSMKPKDVSGEQLTLSDKSYIGNWKQQLVEEAGENPITIFKPDVSIALITVHQYDSQYTKAIENFSLSDAIKQMDPVDYKSFYGMGEQISISRAAEIEQGDNKWAFSIEFDLDYNTARISTSTDDYINIEIEKALSIVNNHNENDLISEFKKLAEKEKQAESPDYALAHEEQINRTYEIYQIPSGERYRDIRFTRYEQLELMGQLPDHLNYEKVYSGNLDDIEYNDKLEGIFVKFNNNRPEDFKGRSLSVSDVVVIEDENGKSAHFVDDVGFKDITDIFFEHERKEPSVEQLNINDYESIRLVSRSEWDDHTLGDDENPAFEEISVSYTPDEDGSYTKYAYNTTNSSLVDVWDEENSVSGDELLEDIANHLKKMGQDNSNRSYHIVLTDYDGNTRKLDSNNFSFILEDKQRKKSEIAASDLELEKSIEEGIIGSMGYPIDEMDKALEAENSKTDYGNEAEPARKKSGNDIEVGDRFLYNNREYTVTSDKGIYPDDVGVSYEEKVGNTSYLTTQNVDRYKLADNGIFLGNSEKQIENSPMGNYDEELKKAAEYLRAYNEREFAISPDNEPFTKDSLSHIGLGYTEIGDNADYSFEVEADLEKYEVRYFIDEKLVKTDKYNSLQEMNEQELSNLEFDYFVSEGNEMLDKMLEAGELILTDIKEEAPLRKISNENNSYMIVDDVRHAIDEIFSGTASDGRKSGGYDWKNYHTAFKSVLDANVQSDIALPLYKSDAEKILLAAQSENTDTISDKEYENALSCLDMVLKNGHLLENPKEKEVEQFSFFGTKSHYVSMDEIKPSFSKHKEPEAEKDVVSKTDKSDITTVNSDYTITENNYGDFGGDKTRCQNNIAAIRLLKQIESEKRNASPDEQQILAKYIGWGGLANAFDSSKAEWHKEYSELKELLSPDEYASARASTLNAHYTSYTVINAIYSTLDNMGFKGGKILEPAMGTGNFFGSMPEEMRKNSSLSGVELDSITGRIAKLLYPSANIQIKGYERTSYENNSFDVAVSNVPFGSYKVNDKDYNKQNMLIHDYFFAKTLDKVRPGGIVAFVTSKGTLDKESPEVRKYLAERAELLGAIRLPNTAFKQNAGTEVTSDIIFLQKREKPVSVEQNTPEWVFKDILPNGIAVNKYFADHPEMILGEMVEGNKLYGNQANATMCVPIEGANLKEQLAAAIHNIKGEYREAPKTAEKEEKSSVVSCPPEAQKFSYIVQNDTLYYHGSNDTMDIVDNPQTERIKAMAFLRDSVHNLLELQINNYNGNKEIEIANAQKALSEQYDTFVEKYGRIGLAENKKAFANDNSYHLLKSLEKMDNNGNFIGKADIFSKKTINPQVIIDHCNNAQDALILSLSEKMRVDMDYMSILTDKSESELIAELGDKIYQNPQKNMRWESADEYLTGNIRTKLAAAEEAGLERNAEALRAVMPQRIEAADISVKLGSAWIDPEYIRQFILETIKPDFQTRNSIEVIYSEATDKWKIEGYQHSYGNTLATETYGTSDMNAYEIIEASLNMKKAEIRERVKDEKGVEIRDEKGHYVLAVNQEKTMVVQSKQDELKRKFQDWIFAEPGRRETLTNLYNEKFNSVRLREYDGSHLNFVGMNSDIALKPHQKNAVARSLYSNGNTLLAHEVGAGKTFEMVAIAMEGKRLGLHSKSLVTAPNALTEQWGEAFRTLYPNANVLVATEKDFKPENRRDLFAKIATGDWDAVIIGHSQFDMIHLSRDRELDVLYSEVDKLEAALEEMSETSMSKRSYSVKQVERAIKSYTDKIEKLLEKTPKDDMLCFEQLGIDKIFVDESQAYKNLDTPTKMQNVSGIGSGGSGRSMQLLMKCRYLDEVTGGKGVVFASGTPISNSMSEMYTLMRYLQADKLKELGINSFDRWASIFGETTTSMELSPEANGKYQMKTRFAKFQNLPELMNIFKECADIKTAATLNLDRPDFEMHNINVPATQMQSKMIKELGERAKLIRAGAVEPTEDNMCKLTVDGRKIGLDQRCMDPSLPDDPNSKVNVCINNVFNIWKQTAENKSTQLIFCDLATPQAAVNENTYTLYRKDTEGKYAPIYSGKLGQKDTADKIFKKLTGKKPPKNFEAGGVFDEDIIMLHTVDYDSMTANNSAVIASNGKISEIPAEMWTELHHSPTETFESERKFCVYDDIKQKLIAKGIPEKEIAFIHDADTTEEKQKLFAKMNKGELRVLIGSTQKCGAGMNAQERMIALHDLDAPMRPSDMEQRHGRIIRQGNTNSKVDIYRYTTDKTFDAYLYQMLENKQKFISQIMTDKSPVRSCEDVDEIALDYAEVKALCAGNPLIKEKIDLETEITKLNVLKSSFLSQKYAVQDKAYTILPREKSVKEAYIDKLKKDVEFAEKEQPLKNEDGKNYYPVTVGDKEYHEKDAAGEAIRQAILDNKDILQGKESHIGTYRGFEMTAFLDTLSKKIKVNLKNETNHYGELNMDSNVKAGGNIIRLDNVINSIGITLMKEEERLQAICADIEESKAAAEAEFPQEQELTLKEKRLAEVNNLLASTEVNTEDRSSELYAALVEICPALKYNDDLYCRYEASDGIEPLTIERKGDVVFIAHTYTQNGDLMYDPAIEFSFDTENQKAEAISYEFSGMGVYKNFSEGNLPEDKADVEIMALETMFENIKAYDYKLVETNIDIDDERGTERGESR